MFFLRRISKKENYIGKESSWFGTQYTSFLLFTLGVFAEDFPSAVWFFAAIKFKISLFCFSFFVIGKNLVESEKNMI